jgi:hypothetical protein
VKKQPPVSRTVALRGGAGVVTLSVSTDLLAQPAELETP